MRTIAPLCFLLGCPASVTADAVDDFGLPVSAVWSHVKGEAGSDGVVISNVGDLCTKEQAFYAAQKEFTKAAGDVLSNNYCEDLEEPLTTWVEAVQAIQYKGASYVSLSATDFDEGEYGFGEKASGSVVTYDDSPLEGLLADFDPDKTVLDGCGISSYDTDPTAVWTIDHGSLTLETVDTENVAVGSADGTLIADKSGDPDGDIEVHFSAAYCEIDP